MVTDDPGKADLRDYQLILCDGKEDESSYPKDVFRLRDDVRGAQGILLGTPEYHGSFSGVLKNALDLMDFDEFQGKMLGLVGVSGGQLGATNALAERLRNVGRQVARFAFLHSSKQAQQFLEAWEGAQPNPGGAAHAD